MIVVLLVILLAANLWGIAFNLRRGHYFPIVFFVISLVFTFLALSGR